MTTFKMLSVTPAAIEHLLSALSTLAAGKGKHVRLSVLSGGCSGFKYDWTFDLVTNDNDILIPLDKTTYLIVRTDSHEILEGSVIDLVSINAFSKELRITNPNAHSQCGCGESFS